MDAKAAAAGMSWNERKKYTELGMRHQVVSNPSVFQMKPRKSIPGIEEAIARYLGFVIEEEISEYLRNPTFEPSSSSSGPSGYNQQPPSDYEPDAQSRPSSSSSAHQGHFQQPSSSYVPEAQSQLLLSSSEPWGHNEQPPRSYGDDAQSQLLSSSSEPRGYNQQTLDSDVADAQFQPSASSGAPQADITDDWERIAIPVMQHRWFKDKRRHTYIESRGSEDRGLVRLLAYDVAEAACGDRSWTGPSSFDSDMIRDQINKHKDQFVRSRLSPDEYNRRWG